MDNNGLTEKCKNVNISLSSPLKLSRAELGQNLDGRPAEKTRLLLVEVLVRGALTLCGLQYVGPNTPVK